ncbi:MAG: tyrosine-type recombinase/integrase [Alphaproteobacteria bacterium]|nr:tyrosine-type recombinase/integrase [Alphaproteobacteria bacterium]
MFKGTVAWLIDRFQRDKKFYKDLSPKTQQEIDYVFNILQPYFGDIMVKNIKRRHCRAFYNKMSEEFSTHKTHKVMKYFRRLLNYGIEEDLRSDNPASALGVKSPDSRKLIWEQEEVLAVVKTALKNNRRSIAIATMVGYDSSQRPQDIVHIKKEKLDDEGVTVTQFKKGKEVWVLLSDLTFMLINEAPKNDSEYLIISESTGKEYLDRSALIKEFGRMRNLAGVNPKLQFRDLRRTVATEIGNKGATLLEITAITGHELNSPVIKTYVKPEKEAARRAIEKRQS